MKNASYIFHLTDLKKFRDEMHRVLDFRFDEFQQKIKIVEILPSNSKIEWLKSSEILLLFYNLLLKHIFIDCDWDYFRVHFTGTGDETTTQKITFLKETNQLPYIMKFLAEGHFIIQPRQKHIHLTEHFLDRFGEPIKTGVLRTSLNKSVGKKNKKFIDENIIIELEKYK